MLKPKVVVDTNVFVSAHLISNGNPARVIDCWIEGNYLLLVSKPIIEEIIRVLYEKGIDTKRIEKLLFLLSQKAILVTPKEEIFVIKNDPADNKFLECAASGRTAYIVSGDKHLLELVEYKEIKILTPKGFLDVLQEQKRLGKSIVSKQSFLEKPEKDEH
ncbi:MAG: putative toxin-antitoxin system toxin component, PIN family [Nitrospirota bacterium]